MDYSRKLQIVVERITQFFTERVNVEPGSPETDLIESGLLDSLTFVDLLVYIEEVFGVRIPLEQLELDSCRTIDRLARLVLTPSDASVAGAVGSRPAATIPSGPA